jgi:hypothetical protein
MPYYVGTFVELENSVIVCYDWDKIKVGPPYPEFYYGCTIWCYNKNDKSIKWIIEEPPIARNDDGVIWNREGVSILATWPIGHRNECYLDISYSKYDDALSADTTGARRFRVNQETGEVTLIATGLR